MRNRLAPGLFGLSLLALLLAVGPRAHAGEPPAAAAPPHDPPTASPAGSLGLIIILGGPFDRFALTVQAELEALGFSAEIRAPASDTISRASLEAAARQAGALAAIRTQWSDSGAEVWIADRVTGKTVLRFIQSDAVQSREALALRTVELLRASLLEVTLPDRTPPPDSPPEPADLRDTLRLHYPHERPPAPKLRAEVAAALLVSPGGLPPSAQLHVGASWMPSDRIGLAAFASIPLSRSAIERFNGRADLAALMVGQGVRFRFMEPACRWCINADLGLAALWLRSSATATGFAIPRDVSVLAAAPYARLGLAFAPIPAFRFRADLLTAVVLQGVSLQFASHEVASWGQPAVALSLGTDFGWF